MKKRILVVEDEARIREVVEYAFAREGWETVAASDGKAGLDHALAGGFDALVLDVMLPEIDGLELCRRLRSARGASGRLPVLFLSARAEELDRIVGLEIGGDDYLTKPFSPRELVARMRALLRRTGDSPEPDAGDAAPTSPAPRRRVAAPAVAIDSERHEARCRGKLVALTKAELAVLAALFERPGLVLSRGQLMRRAGGGDDGEAGERAADTHVKRIRAKFREHGVDPIATVHGVGYKANEDPSGAGDGQP